MFGSLPERCERRVEQLGMDTDATVWLSGGVRSPQSAQSCEQSGAGAE